jgi:hypothetical protein
VRPCIAADGQGKRGIGAAVFVRNGIHSDPGMSKQRQAYSDQQYYWDIPQAENAFPQI